MSDILCPADEDELRDAIADAAAEGRPLAVHGNGTKAGFGRPVAAAVRLSAAALSGITYYEPGELVMEAWAGTPIAEIEAVLAANGQRLAFEPPDFGPLYGEVAGAAGQGTVGGVFGCNLSGPRRPFAGAARDHLLGVRAVSGRGEIFAAGGRVVKNVTGYDMGKLLAGAHGTLAVMSRVTFKVLPAPEAEHTVVLFGAGPKAAANALMRAAGSQWDITGAAYLGAGAAARSAVAEIAEAGQAVTAVRMEGAREAVLARAAGLRTVLSEWGESAELRGRDTRILWREIGVGALLPAADAGGLLWRLSVPPAAGVGTAEALAEFGGEWLLDWAGGLVWLALPDTPDEKADAAADRVHRAAAMAGGHAILIRAADPIRARVAVFAPQDRALAALTRRIKRNFDPAGVLNPGRMYDGV